MLMTLTNGMRYRLYFRYHHTQSVMIKRYNGKIDYNESEIRIVKEPVVTECFLQLTEDDDPYPFDPAYSYRGISAKSPEDAPNKEVARCAAISHMAKTLSCKDAVLVWEAYYGRLKGNEGHAST